MLVCWGFDAVLSIAGLWGRWLPVFAPARMPECAMAAVVHRGFERGPEVRPRGSYPEPARAPAATPARTGSRGAPSSADADSAPRGAALAPGASPAPRMRSAPKGINVVTPRGGIGASPALQRGEPVALPAAPVVDAAMRNRLVVSVFVFVALVGAMTYLFFGAAITEIMDLRWTQGSASRGGGTGFFPEDLPPTGAGPRRAVPGRSSSTEGAMRAADDALAAAERALAAQHGALPAKGSERPAVARKDRRASGVITHQAAAPAFAEAERAVTRGAARSADAAVSGSPPRPAGSDTATPLGDPPRPCTPNAAALGLCTAPTIHLKD